MLKWMKHNCDLTGEHATIHVFDSDPTSVGWAGFNFDGKEEVSLKPFLKRLWVIVPFFCFLILKDFCRFLTDFSQLYLLHWGFRNCSNDAGFTAHYEKKEGLFGPKFKKQALTCVCPIPAIAGKVATGTVSGEIYVW